MPFLTVLAILALAAAVIATAMLANHLSLFAPGKTAAIRGAAQSFCLDDCKRADGSCPLGDKDVMCPLWRFVAADVPTGTRVNALRPLASD